MATEQRVLRVAVYERVSSDIQRERESIQNQVAANDRFLETRPDLSFVARYQDNGVSGSVPMNERPEGQKLLADAAKDRFDLVLFTRVDRLGRDAEDAFKTQRQLLSRGVKLIASNESIESNFVYRLLSILAEDERERITGRITEGMERAAREGRYTGGISSYGYRVEGHGHRATVVPADQEPVWGDLTEADVIRKMYHLSAVEGWSCARIAEEFNELGIPTHYAKDGRGVRNRNTQAVWRAGRIRNMLVSPVYKGVLQFGKRSTKPRGREVITSQVEPLVSEETWEAAQRTLEQNRRMPVNTRRRYLLRGVMECGHCGLGFVGTHGSADGRVYYRCGGKHRERGKFEGKCPSKAVSGRDLEPVIWADIERYLRDPGDILDELSQEAQHDDSAAVAEAERISLRKELDSLKSRRSRLVDLYSRGRIGDEELDPGLDEIDGQRAQLERRLAQLEPEDDDGGQAPVTEDLLAELRRRLDDGLTDEQRQEIVSLLVKRITVHAEVLESGRKRARCVVEYRFANCGRLPDTGKGSWRTRA